MVQYFSKLSRSEKVEIHKYSQYAEASYNLDQSGGQFNLRYKTTVSASGFAAGLYQEPNGQYVLSIRGTEFSKLNDIHTDLLLGAGHTGGQLEDAMTFVEKLKTEHGINDFIITGHSLGGSLAHMLGLITGKKAFAFNSPEVETHKTDIVNKYSSEGISKASLDRNNDKLVSINHEQDPVSKIGETISETIVVEDTQLVRQAMRFIELGLFSGNPVLEVLFGSSKVAYTLNAHRIVPLNKLIASDISGKKENDPLYVKQTNANGVESHKRLYSGDVSKHPNANKMVQASAIEVSLDSNTGDALSLIDPSKTIQSGSNELFLVDFVDMLEDGYEAIKGFSETTVVPVVEGFFNGQSLSMVAASIALEIANGGDFDDIIKKQALRNTLSAIALKVIPDVDFTASEKAMIQRLETNTITKADVERLDAMLSTKHQVNEFKGMARDALTQMAVIVIMNGKHMDGQDYVKAAATTGFQVAATRVIDKAFDINPGSSIGAKAGSAGVSAAVAYLGSALISDGKLTKGEVLMGAALGVASFIGNFFGGPIGGMVAQVLVSKLYKGKVYKAGEYPDPSYIMDRIRVIREKPDGTGFETYVVTKLGAIVAARPGFDNDFYGNDGPDVFLGGDGKTLMVGRGGPDTLIAKTGVSTIAGNSGPDHIEGGNGVNFIDAGPDSDSVIIPHRQSKNTINTDTGDDVLYSVSEEFNEIELGDGDDVADLGDGIHQVYAGTGKDEVTVGDGDNFVHLGEGDDTCTVGNGNNNIQGGDGTDTVYTGDGNNYVDGGSGPDRIFLGAGDDIGLGGDGADNVKGGKGKDLLLGGLGPDTLAGDEDPDELQGGLGPDTLIGGNDDDLLKGGQDNDTYLYSKGDGHDTIIEEDGVNEKDSADTLHLVDIELDDVELTKSGHDLKVTFKHDPSGSILIKNQFLSSRNRMEILEDGNQYIDLRNITINPDGSLKFAIQDAIGKSIFVERNDFNQESHTRGYKINSGFHKKSYDTGNVGNAYKPYSEYNNVVQVRWRKKKRRFGNVYRVYHEYRITTLDDRAGYWGYNVGGKDRVYGNPKQINANNKIVGNYWDEKITLYGGNNIAYGNAGNDKIDATQGTGNNLVYGNDGADQIKLGPGDDKAYGGTGDDEIHTGGGNDAVYGGFGIDRLFAEDDDDFVSGGLGPDYIDAGRGNDIVDAGPGDDEAYGREGDDFMEMGDGDDRAMGGPGNDGIICGPGNDYASGGSGSDIMAGGDGNDNLHGNEGPDTIYGDDGTDSIHGGDDGDELYGGNGPDKIFGESGPDYIEGNADSDYLDGGDDNDTIDAGSGQNTLIGGRGDDELKAGPDSDTYRFKKGDGIDVVHDSGTSAPTPNSIDVLIFEDRDTEALRFSRDGDDLIIRFHDHPTDQVTVKNHFLSNGQSKVEKIQCGNWVIDTDRLTIDTDNPDASVRDLGDGDDVTSVPAGLDNTITLGGPGNDQILGNERNNIIKGEGGNNVMYGEQGDDELYTGTGHGKAYGGPGDDKLVGEGQSAYLDGGADNDRLQANQGMNSFVGGTGDDALQGGIHSDTYLFKRGDGRDSIEEPLLQADFFQETSTTLIPVQDKIIFEDRQLEDLKLTRAKDDLLINFQDAEDDRVTVKDQFKDPAKPIIEKIVCMNKVINASNIIIGTHTNNTITGTSEVDVVFANSGNDIISTGDGPDTVFTGQGDDTVYTGKGNDTITCGFGNNFVDAGEGNDLVKAIQGNNILLGGPGEDRLEAGTGRDLLNGGDGPDTLVGTSQGETTYIGGEGIDSFVIPAAPNTLHIIKDFDVANETLTFNSFAHPMYIFMSCRQHGNHTIITLPEGQQVILQNVAVNDLSVYHFKMLSVRYDYIVNDGIRSLRYYVPEGTTQHGNGRHDMIVGLSGNNVLSGGPGVDYFYISRDEGSYKEIYNFNVSNEKIGLLQFNGNFSSYADLKDGMVQNGDDTTIALAGQTLTLKNLNWNQLSRFNFYGTVSRNTPPEISKKIAFFQGKSNGYNFIYFVPGGANDLSYSNVTYFNVTASLGASIRIFTSSTLIHDPDGDSINTYFKHSRLSGPPEDSVAKYAVHYCGNDGEAETCLPINLQFNPSLLATAEPELIYNEDQPVRFNDLIDVSYRYRVPDVDFEFRLNPADFEWLTIGNSSFTFGAEYTRLSLKGGVNETYLNNTLNSMHIVPKPDRYGNATMTLTFSDGFNKNITRVMNITGIPVYDPPKAQHILADFEASDNFTANVVGDYTFNRDGHELRIVNVTNPRNGTIEFNATHVTYIPDTADSRDDSLEEWRDFARYTVSDGKASDEKFILFDIYNPNFQTRSITITDEIDTANETNTTDEIDTSDITNTTNETSTADEIDSSDETNAPDEIDITDETNTSDEIETPDETNAPDEIDVTGETGTPSETNTPTVSTSEPTSQDSPTLGASSPSNVFQPVYALLAFGWRHAKGLRRINIGKSLDWAMMNVCEFIDQCPTTQPQKSLPSNMDLNLEEIRSASLLHSSGLSFFGGISETGSNTSITAQNNGIVCPVPSK